MTGIILDIYFGGELAETLTSSSIIVKIFTLTNLIYFGVFIFLILGISILVFAILPRVLKTPEKYFKRYLLVREELERIDNLYSRKKMSYEDYSFAQFHYAKEYEQIIIYLSNFPEYKSKLQSYKLTAVKVREDQESKLSPEQIKNLETTNYFFDLLKPRAPYYQKGEIYQAILDEGYNKEIAKGIVDKLDASGVEFDSKEKEGERRVIDLVDTIIAARQSMAPKKVIDNKSKPIETAKPLESAKTSMDLKDLAKPKTQEPSFGENTTTFSKYSDYRLVKTKKTFIESIKHIFKPKEKPHTISEINDIFKDIEKTIKEKK